MFVGKSKLEEYFADFTRYQPPQEVVNDTNDPPEVFRAKYFIRDEFLVRIVKVYVYLCFLKPFYDLNIV